MGLAVLYARHSNVLSIPGTGQLPMVGVSPCHMFVFLLDPDECHGIYWYLE